MTVYLIGTTKLPPRRWWIPEDPEMTPEEAARLAVYSHEGSYIPPQNRSQYESLLRIRIRNLVHRSLATMGILETQKLLEDLLRESLVGTPPEQWADLVDLHPQVELRVVNPAADRVEPLLGKKKSPKKPRDPVAHQNALQLAEGMTLEELLERARLGGLD